MKAILRERIPGIFEVALKETLGEQVIAIFANILSLAYYIILGITHSYAWYVLLLQNLFIMSSPMYIFLPVAVAMSFYYVMRLCSQPYFWRNNDFWRNNYKKLSNIFEAADKHKSGIFNYRHFQVLSNLITPSFSIILLLYCIMNSFTPAPADMMLYLVHPMLATLAGIAIITLIYLAFRPFTPAAAKNKKLALSGFKTTSYIIFNMLFYIACGILFGAVIHFFFNPIFNYHFCGLGSLASWMTSMAFVAAFLSSTLLFYCHEKDFQQQAAEFYDDCQNSRFSSTTLNAFYGAACGVILAVIIFSIMFAPMIHIVPNIWPQVFGILSQASFNQALSQVSYISAVVGAGFSLLDSAFTIDTDNKSTLYQRFNDACKDIDQTLYTERQHAEESYQPAPKKSDSTDNKPIHHTDNGPIHHTDYINEYDGDESRHDAIYNL